ncbi:PAS domain-containing sensor histidine kinase [Nocardioides marmoribigeumensis]|uniref:histidine kinase n=1 Tax=Nocardioides marmoribigeumensis TaxID=433649 RepID=A0ABU2C0A5_9ACTN|nr:ATP-binding protein [Nocardioides marmoribigeumensis]MDR7364094.1 PAS domain S-box-containing protein [Nocardioides marmoribigeumensis]
MSTPVVRPSTPAWTRALLAVAVLLVAAYVVWTLPGVRPRPGFDSRFDGLLQGSAYSLVAVLAVVGARQRGTTTAAWWCVVASLVLRAVGFDVSLVGLSVGREPNYPDWSDAAWVLSSVLLFAGLALRLRELSPRLSVLVALDGVSAALVALGVALSALSGPLGTLTGPGVPHRAIVMNVVYPVLDIGLLVLAAAAVATARLRMTRSDLVLLGGVLAIVVVDVTYFVLLAEGLWRPGTALSSLSLVATAVIAVAMTTSLRPLEPAPRAPGELPAADLASGVVVPAVLIGSLLVILAFSEVVTTPVVPALLCYVAGGALAVTRGVRTVRSVQEEAGRAVGEAGFDLGLFKALVDASGDFIGMADERGRPIYVNPSGRRMIGVPGDADVTALEIGRLAPGATADEFPRRWRALLSEGSWSGRADLVPVDDGPTVPVEISTFLVGSRDTQGRQVAGTIQRDISERIRAEAALRDLVEQRSRLLQRLVQAQEDERQRIAHDVHDDPVQALAAVDLRLGLLRRRLATEAPDATDDVTALQEIVAGATERLRNLLFDLESLPEGVSLSDALTEAAGFVFHGTDVSFRVAGEDDLPLPEGERVLVNRVVKEALVNARKHASATTVVVDLAVQDHTAVVTVDDDGRGIPPGADRDRPGHVGLAGMRDLAQVAGATLEVGRRPEGGTRVRMTLPVEHRAD